MAAELVQPKKAVSAYWIWLGENREAIAKECGVGKGSVVAKAAGEKWKKMGDKEKAPFEKRAAEDKARFEKEMAEFTSQGGVKQKRKSKKDEAEGKRAKKAKDPNRPKKPAGGAYGCYLAANREEIKKSLPAGHKITDVTKKAGELWKSLAAKDKAKYEAEYKKKQDIYLKEMEAYKAKGGADDDDEEEGEEEN
eukprot:TRINITY_DN419_c0_g1_i2.p2 TRINITY_DN419_c0_g1~~TRINITY_DN419_c0_g1_i2.p2  ORF type:complete len:210 (+),score=87.56 TRINITY_DN419_c0_g1_i2:51-632(+)